MPNGAMPETLYDIKGFRNLRTFALQKYFNFKVTQILFPLSPRCILLETRKLNKIKKKKKKRKNRKYYEKFFPVREHLKTN